MNLPDSSHTCHKYLLSLLAALLCLCTLTGCSSSKEAADTAALFADLDLKKYTIYDTSSQFAPGSVVSAYKIISGDFMIEYYDLPSAEQASRAFQNNRTTFQQAVPALSNPLVIPIGIQETTESIPYYEDTASGSNYERYCLITEDSYYVVSRIDTTFVYISTDRKNLKQANQFLKSTGYY